ncbi:hypothetical protein MASR2M15_25110 [Anaerolineales bacterium]
MVNHDSDYIDQILQNKINNVEKPNMLHLELIHAMEKPRAEYVEELKDNLNKYINQNNTRKRQLYRLRDLRYLWIAATLLFLLVVSMVLAINPLLQEIIYADPGLKTVFEAGLGTELELSQTHGDFTVEIPWVYADSNRLSIGYLITANNSERYTNLEILEPVISDGNGDLYPINREGLTLIGENQASGQIQADLSSIANLGNKLDLHLSLHVGYITETRRTEIPQPKNLDEWILLSEEFNFDFILPIIDGYFFQPKVIAQSAGISMSLNELVITPSSGYILLCYSIPDKPIEEGWEWYLDPINISFGVDHMLVTESRRWDPKSGCSRVDFLPFPVTLKEGDWKIVIGGIRGVRTRLPDKESLKLTVQAVGGAILDTDGDLEAIELPEGAAKQAGLEKHIEGQWIFIVPMPPLD